MRFRKRSLHWSEEPPIFTYRDERKLFALIAVIIAAALLALLQIGAQRSGSSSPISSAVSSFFGFAQSIVAATTGGVRTAGTTIASLPSLSQENQQLRVRNARLTEENARLHELAAAYAAETAIRPVVDLYHGIEARVIGFPPENESRAITIDKGSRAGVRRGMEGRQGGGQDPTRDEVAAILARVRRAQEGAGDVNPTSVILRCPARERRHRRMAVGNRSHRPCKAHLRSRLRVTAVGFKLDGLTLPVGRR